MHNCPQFGHHFQMQRCIWRPSLHGPKNERENWASKIPKGIQVTEFYFLIIYILLCVAFKHNITITQLDRDYHWLILQKAYKWRNFIF